MRDLATISRISLRQQFRRIDGPLLQNGRVT
jgi:hypothetical protein